MSPVVPSGTSRVAVSLIGSPIVTGDVACVEIDSAQHVRSAHLRPTMQLSAGVLRPDSTARAATLIDSLSALDFPLTGVLVSVDGTLRRRSAPDSVAAVPQPLAPRPRSR